MRLSIVLSCSVAMLLCACSKPEPPEKERPPEPQAESQASQPRATQLRDAIQAPIDKAKSVEQTTLDAAEKQRAEIDAQAGG